MSVIGVDLGGTNVRAGLVRAGKLAKLEARPIRSGGSEREVLADLCAAIDAVRDRGVAAIGIGVPSLVDPKTGVLFDTTNIPSWKEVPLKKRLEKRYGVPVHIDNDANCFALGEKHFGAAKRANDFVGMVIGTGLGAGIVANGRLVSGAYRGAGEFGTVPYRDGILEHYASGQFFGGDGPRLAKAAAAGDAKARATFDAFGTHVAFAFKLVLYSVAPSLIVLGGSVSRSFPHFERALRQGLADFAYPHVRDTLVIKVSKLAHGAVLGAASLTA